MTIDPANPVTPDDHQPVGAPTDARNRAVRTFVQNLLLDVLVAVLLFLWPIVSNGAKLSDFDWPLLAFSFAKTVVVTVVAYLMRALGVSPGTTTR